MIQNWGRKICRFVGMMDHDKTTRFPPLECGPFLYNFAFNDKVGVGGDWMTGDGLVRQQVKAGSQNFMWSGHVVVGKVMTLYSC